MGFPKLAKELRDEAKCCCDEDLRGLLERAANVLDGFVFQGPCMSCGERPSEVSGECRPCYQRHRRAGR